MFRKFFTCVSVAGLLLLGASAGARSLSQESQPKHQTEQGKSVSGKVTDIGSDKRSFSLEVNDKDTSNSNKKTMQFVIDDNTQVQGRVTVGTNALVQYQPTSDGKNLALNITPQGNGGGGQ